ncbi:MAG: AsnC family transcriptional regulator, partial [Synergistaceae bacterium]|nr:AsnC family transcriptional regulator [Synergistaceae bacterium]
MDELDKRLVRELQGNIPHAENPYLELGLRLGISEDEVVEQLKALKESGRLKRIAAVLRHQRSGYAANAMAVFLVPEAAMDMLGGKLA